MLRLPCLELDGPWRILQEPPLSWTSIVGNRKLTPYRIFDQRMAMLFERARTFLLRELWIYSSIRRASLTRQEKPMSTSLGLCGT